METLLKSTQTGTADEELTSTKYRALLIGPHKLWEPVGVEKDERKADLEFSWPTQGAYERLQLGDYIIQTFPLIFENGLGVYIGFVLLPLRPFLAVREN